VYEEDEPVCICPNMTDTNIEFVEAIRVYYTKEPSYFENNKFKHYCNCAIALGVNNIVMILEQMMLLDYLILNHDRHFKNFGILRDSQTLKIIGAAPVFDNGSSLFHEDRADAIKLPEKPKMRSECFDTLDNQLKLIKDWSWFNGLKLEGISAISKELLLSVDSVEKKRAEKIADVLEKRIETAHLTSLQTGIC